MDPIEFYTVFLPVSQPPWVASRWRFALSAAFFALGGWQLRQLRRQQLRRFRGVARGVEGDAILRVLAGGLRGGTRGELGGASDGEW